jgi:hypothetical protein
VTDEDGPIATGRDSPGGSDGGGEPGRSDDGPMRERGSGSAVKTWVLMGADRLVLTGVLLAIIGLLLVAFGLFDAVGFRAALRSGDPVETFFQAMVTAIVTGVTLVITINQLILSQELGPFGDQASRMEGAMDVRERVESHVDDAVSAAEPAEFLQSLVAAARGRAKTLSDAAAATPASDATLADDLAALGAEVERNAAAVEAQLETAEFGTFDVLDAALNFEYSTKLHEIRRIRAVHADRLAGDTDDVLAELRETLELYGATREHVKTLYFQWELITLSRVVLYASVPALATAIAMILFFDDPGSVPGRTLGVENVALFVSAAVLVTVTPFLLVVSYILRIVTVTQRTLAIGPFVLRETETPAEGPE